MEETSIALCVCVYTHENIDSCVRISVQLEHTHVCVLAHLAGRLRRARWPMAVNGVCQQLPIQCTFLSRSNDVALSLF